MKDALNYNQLIGQLDSHCHHQLLKHGHWVQIATGQQLSRPKMEVEYAYFPTSGVVALIMQQQQDKPIALTVISKEGMVGIASALGVHSEPYASTVLSPGTALRISAQHLYALKLKNKGFCQVLDRYIAMINAQFAQMIVCQGLHDLQQRLAYLLLTYGDRISATDFAMTQALLANLLGVRRSGINRAASTLQQAKILQYSRGKMHILNRTALLKTACQCYMMDKQSYQSIFLV